MTDLKIEAEKRRKNFCNNLDWSKLENAINGYLGLNLEFTHTIGESIKDGIWFYSNENLCNHNLLLSKMSKNCVIDTVKVEQWVEGIEADYCWFSLHIYFICLPQNNKGEEELQKIFFCRADCENGLWKNIIFVNEKDNLYNIIGKQEAY